MSWGIPILKSPFKKYVKIISWELVKKSALKNLCVCMEIVFKTNKQFLKTPEYLKSKIFISVPN